QSTCSIALTLCQHGPRDPRQFVCHRHCGDVDSVPASFANRRVSLHVSPERQVIVAEGQTVCTHDRIIERSHHNPLSTAKVFQHL
ncbi:hypothetical protein SAMN05444414_1547, partial [Roseovarius marisflavi]